MSFFGTLYAATIDEVDCDKLLKAYASHETKREVFVIIDKTTAFPESMQKNALVNILALANPETTIDIFTFSEHNKDGYLEFIGGYYFDSELAEKDKGDLSSLMIKAYAKCLDAADSRVRTSLTTDFYSAIRSHTFEQNLTRSDILYSLQDVAASAVDASKAQQKIVFILSDMLENSPYLSFYMFSQLASMGIGEALDVVRRNGLFADFGGTDVFVIGAGLSPYRQMVRDVRDKDTLKTFWGEYFKYSNANLRRFEESPTYPVEDVYK